MNLLSLIPGGLLSLILFVFLFAPITMFLFKSFKRKLDLIEISLLSLTFSLVLVPLIAWILNFVLPFNYLLLGITFAIPLLISMFLFLTKRITFDKELFSVSKSSLIILFIFLVAFFLRVQSLSSFFYEFDPYWYGMVTEFLVQDGFVPMNDDLAYTHEGSGHRALPLTHHLTSTWYLLLAGDTYDNLQNAYIMNLYPPLLGALIAFLAYFLFKNEYGTWIAIAAAVVFAFTPVLLQKFIAGVAEQLPWGLAFGFAGIVFVHYALTSKDRRMYIPFLIALVGALLGSKAGMIPLIIGIGYIGLCAVKDFILKVQNKAYYELSFCIMLVVAISNLLYNIYSNTDLIKVFIDSEFLFALFTFIVTFMFFYFEDIKSKLKLQKINLLENRLQLVGVLTILGILFLFTIGSPLLNYISSLAQVGLTGESALMKTVAEENLYAGSLTSKFGFMGVSLDVSKFTQPIIGKYGSLGAFPLIYVALICAFIYGFVYRKSNLLLLLILFIAGISVIGLQKVKYTPHLGLVLALALVTVAGESYNFLKDKKENDIKKYTGYLMLLILGAMILYALISYLFGFIAFLNGTGYITYFPLVTFEMQLLFVGIVCALIYFAWKFYKQKNYEQVFAFSLIVLLLPFVLMMIEVVPYSVANLSTDGTNYTQVSDFCTSVYKSGASVSTSYYCAIIPQYWYDTMMFMKENTPEKTRFISWWDYGHWTNFFAMRNTVTRNDHPAGAEENEVVADKFVANNVQALRDYMDVTGSTYVLLDQDLISKWGALTYLSCVHNKETTKDELPSESECSADYQFEKVYIPVNAGANERCMIGETFGVIGYSSFKDRGYCVMKNSGYTIFYDVQTQQQLNRIPVSLGNTQIQNNIYNEVLVIYPLEEIVNAPGRGYNSIFYKAFFLGELDGFEQVYPTTTGVGIFPTRIYKKV